jgi:NhaA family Na+:H+ antiporter
MFITRAFRAFLKLESAGGILLFCAAVLAVVFSNTQSLIPHYQAIFHSEFSLGPIHSHHSLTHWINDGLMAIFFFLVGLEIKREVLKGELSTPSSIALPAFAAAGGMAVPALIYFALNRGDPVAIAGWAIPTATDIAFALGVLMLLGSRVPLSLKVFLTALAIIDDLAAIIIIALFYTAELSRAALGFSALAVVVLALLNRFGVRRFWPYLLGGLVLWLLILNSGVHATLAGVLLAFTIPIDSEEEGGSLLEHVEHALHPWVAFLILPLFAFANAGLPLREMSFSALFQPIPLGIALGLLVGKQIGVFGAAALAIKLGWAKLPEGAGWLGLYAVSALCGIGFTMSLFIGSLAFKGGGPDFLPLVQLGVFTGSLIALIIGLVALIKATRPPSSITEGTTVQSENGLARSD